jgi:uncharacterized protein
MKKILCPLAVTLSLSLLPFFSSAQSDYKVVFDFTSKDSLDQKAVIRWLNEISKAEPNAQMEVVMYGQGFNLVLKDKSYVANDVVRLAASKNISFKVCAVSLKNNKIDVNQLLDGVTTVPDGIYEVISKQHQGWGYIKVKN